MPTDLFVATSGWPSSALADVVPPACRRDVEAAPAPRRDGDDAVVELPVWRPRRAARHLVPAFSALHPAPASFRFEVSLERAGRWSAWVAGATIGEARFAPLGGRTDGLAAEVDEFVAEAPAHAVRVRLRLRVDDRHAPLAAPWLVSLSAWDGSLPEPDTAPGGGAVRLAVPALSQMDADEAIRMRICSPASVAMVLAYWSARAWATCSSGRPRPPAAPLHGHEDIVAGVSPGPGRTQVAVQCGANAQRGDPDRSGTGGSARGLLERR